MARFGLLLSSAVATSVSPLVNIERADIKSQSGGNFTDGCGCVSRDIAVSLYRSTRDLLWRRNQAKRLPSVFQIRYQGIKGILVLNSALDSSTIVTRPSMKKFSTTRFPAISVCDFSRPFSFGHLNRQFIMLLSGLGVDDKVFLDIQQEHFERLRKMLWDRDSALMLLEWRNRAIEFVDDDLEENQNPAGKDIAQPYKHLRQLQKDLIVNDSPKLRILIPQSRTLFGVAETPRYNKKTENRLAGILEPGECMVRLTMRGDKQISLRGPVVVSKNPCYLLGDVRVLRAVSSADRPELRALESDLVDCLVFPIEGERPHSEEIAGSDLVSVMTPYRKKIVHQWKGL